MNIIAPWYNEKEKWHEVPGQDQKRFLVVFKVGSTKKQEGDQR
jgi:hypothetical protein